MMGGESQLFSCFKNIFQVFAQSSLELADGRKNFIQAMRHVCPVGYMFC